MVSKKKVSKESISFNVLDHFLVPKMEILSEKEKKELFEKMKINENNLPLIKVTDPAAKALNAKVGDIIKIERKDEPATYYYYRLVVE